MHSNLAFLFYQSGDYERALIQAEKSIEIGEVVHSDRAIANGLFEKAKALRELGRIRETRPDLERAIRLAEHNQELVYDLSLYYVTLAYVCKAEAKTDEGILHFQKAISLNKSLNDSLGIAMNNADFGYYLYNLGLYNVAANVLQEGIRFSLAPYITARTWDNLGAVYWKKNQYIKALDAYQQGLHTLTRDFQGSDRNSLPTTNSIQSAAYKEYLLTLIQDKADTWLDYAKATNNPQRFQYALDTYKVADQMIDFMRWEHTGQQSKLYWRNKTRGLYERAIETCFQLSNTEQAFRFLEKSRAVMLADKLNELGARQQLSPQQVQEEERLQQAVARQQTKLVAVKSTSSAEYNTARLALFAKQDSLTTFLKQLEVSNPAYYHYKYDNTTASLPDLQRYLKTQQGSLMTYFVGENALYVMGITGDTVILHKQAAGSYTQTVREFTTLLADPEVMNKTAQVERFRRLSHSLYQQLLAPLSLPNGRVIVSPDGGFIPFDALSRSPSQLRYAVDDYAFSYVYSASLWLKNRLSRVRVPGYARGRFLGVAPVQFAPSLKQVALVNADAALVPIAERFTSPTLLTHGAATRRNFLDKAADAQVIHLFTHATADSTNQEPTLYFADSTLRLSDFGDKALPNAELVVLAACKTGIGAVQQGEGVFSLARGFAALGVPSVLTTLWSVQNQATYELTDRFYQHLDEGLPKDVALQKAKQEWLANAEGAGVLPNYWAGLIVVGDAEPLPRLNLALWGSFVVVLTLVAGLIFWHERRRRPVKASVSVHQPV
ncbi:CHAT domain-containing protein [Spirosoma koreense]